MSMSLRIPNVNPSSDDSISITVAYDGCLSHFQVKAACDYALDTVEFSTLAMLEGVLTDDASERSDMEMSLVIMAVGRKTRRRQSAPGSRVAVGSSKTRNIHNSIETV